MKKTIAILLSAVLLVSMLSVVASAASWKNESDWTVNEEDGTVAFPNAYGYVFDIDYVNGTIAGEDATMIDNADSYAACNPNWAISVALAETETEGVYSVLKVVVTPGSAAAAGINWFDAKLVMVVHSASSNPADAATYPNWKSKVAAVALTEGVLVKYEGSKVIVQNEDGTFPEAPADDESDAPSVELVLKNFAEGASYTTSQLYQQGGADVEWGWDDNAPIAYPDEDGKSLTDGVLASNDADYTDAAWAGFHVKAPDYVENGYSWITVDLGEVKSISNVSMNAGTSKNANLATVGIAAPHTVEYFVSNDGETWTSIGAVVPADGPEGTEDISVELAEAVDAQYVQARFTSEGWMFISEIEVEGYVEVVNDDDNTADAGDASNMLVFAVIALVALAGTAVVVKTRR